MTFTPEQIERLEGDLDRAHVKEREQAGRRLSYIEGWHAIAEANRIFGFDAWNTETVLLNCVNAAPCKIGKEPNSYPGHQVSYIARVRVVVGGIVREGVGAGHGRDRDLGLAHESAAKEAETDARKRALMTFGNKFGLALYDKTQRNVSDGADDDVVPMQTAQRGPAPTQAPATTHAQGAKPAQRFTLDLNDVKTWPFNLNDPIAWGKYSGKKDGTEPKSWLYLASGELDGERHRWLAWYLETVDKKYGAEREAEARKDGYKRARAIWEYYESMRVDDPTA